MPSVYRHHSIEVRRVLVSMNGNKGAHLETADNVVAKRKPLISMGLGKEGASQNKVALHKFYTRCFAVIAGQGASTFSNETAIMKCLLAGIARRIELASEPDMPMDGKS